MEFTNEIFFNKSLIKNETVLIKYIGKLYREHSAEVTIVYGFGANWDNTQEKKMVETDDGFEVSIDLENSDTLNFCFKNNYNIWDNNFGFNYISAIGELKETKVNPVEEFVETNEAIVNSKNQNTENFENETNETIEINDNDITNENISEIKIDTDTTTTTSSETISEIETNDDIEKIEYTENEEDEDNDFEETFSELIDSILNFEETNNSDINLENGFGLQSVDNEIEEINITNYDNIFEELYNDIINLKEDNNTENIKSESETKLEDLLNNFSENENNNENNIENNTEDNTEANELMNDILDSIVEEDDDNKSLFELQTSELPSTQYQKQDEDLLDIIIDGSCNIIQKVWSGFKKLGSFIRKTAKFLFEE